MGVALFALNSILIAAEWVCTTMVHSLNKTNQRKYTLFEIKSKISLKCHKNFGIVLRLEPSSGISEKVLHEICFKLNIDPSGLSLHYNGALTK